MASIMASINFLHLFYSSYFFLHLTLDYRPQIQNQSKILYQYIAKEFQKLGS